MSSMAVDPLKIEADSWKIVQASEERIIPATLREMNQQELDLKKQWEASSGPALDAQDTLNAAKDAYTAARSGAARAAAKIKQDEAQKKFDEAYTANRSLVKQYNDAKEAASKEEEKMAFSLGIKQLRQYPGTDRRDRRQGPRNRSDEGRPGKADQDPHGKVHHERRSGWSRPSRTLGYLEIRDRLIL